LESIDLAALLPTDRPEFDRLREQDPRAENDLSGADLSGCDLSGVALGRARLANASLRDADCTGAILFGSDLSGADLRGAKLDGVDMHQTILEGANLEGGNLGGIERATRFCFHISSFRGTNWGREEIETMLGIMNQNASWEIRYDIVPKVSSPA
jgi:uncharacterized protein YjbI with pentapeptide repeats